MKQKRHTTEEIIRIIREAASDKDLEAVYRHDPDASRAGQPRVEWGLPQ